jgi:DNA-binding GntR family transcriptional regulator
MLEMNDHLSMRVESLPNLREQVVERLRLAIASGRFKPGARLVERELCEMMGVSRTSLREALRELQADGLISAQPNRGLSVSVISRKEAEGIYEVRAMLEGLAARLFARHASDGDMKALHRSIDRLEKVYSNFTPEAFIATKSEFYDILLRGAGNETAAAMLRRIHTRASQLRVVSLSSSERAQRSIAELRAFMKALEARDEDKAWKLCVSHVENAAKAALGVLGKTGNGA